MNPIAQVTQRPLEYIPRYSRHEREFIMQDKMIVISELGICLELLNHTQIIVHVFTSKMQKNIIYQGLQIKF
jgi:hypothetical protein